MNDRHPQLAANGQPLAAADAALPRWATPAVLLLGLYLVSLLVTVAFGFALKFRATPFALEADEAEYFLMSEQLLRGAVVLDGRRTLGFPALIAAIRGAGAGFVALQVVICAIYALSAPALFLLAKRLSGSMLCGLLAGATLALWPSGVFFGASLYSEAAALPLFLLALTLLPPGSRVEPADGAGSLGQALLCGLALGITAHMRPMYLLFTPFLCFIIAAEERRVRIAFARMGVALAGFALVVLPWSAFISTRVGQPIVLTANGGETMAGGLSPRLLEMEPGPWEAPGRITWMGPGKWLTLDQNGYLSTKELGLPYADKDALLRARAADWARAHPLDALHLEARKLTYMWGVYPLTQNGPAQFLFGNLPVLALLVFSLAAIIRYRDMRWRLVRLWTLPFFVSAVALISWGSWRFRQPADAGLLALTAIVVVALMLRRRPYRLSAAAT